MKITFCGDFYPSINMINNHIQNNKLFDDQIIKLFKNSHYSFVNLEAPFSYLNNNFKKNLKLAENLSIPQQGINILKELKISHVCLANNHIMDFGQEGLDFTIDTLVSNDIGYLGTIKTNQIKTYKPLTIKDKNNKIAIFNIAEGEESSIKFNEEGVINYDKFEILNTISTYKQRGFFVIIIVHAGVEHIDAPPPHIVNLYRNYCDLGADIVIGHHPHVVQGYEEYLNSKIYYSLGNFLMRKECWNRNTSKGQIITLDINSNNAKVFINYINISKDNISLCANKESSLFDKTIMQNFYNKEIIWDKYVLRNYNPLKLIFKSDLVAFNFSRNILRIYNILSTPSHQYGLLRWIYLNKQKLKINKESKKLKYIIFFKKLLNKFTNFLLRYMNLFKNL